MIQGTYYKEWSRMLGRDMEFKVYGHAGTPWERKYGSVNAKVDSIDHHWQHFLEDYQTDNYLKIELINLNLEILHANSLKSLGCCKNKFNL